MKVRGTATVAPAGPCVACKVEGTARVSTAYGVLCDDPAACGRRYRAGATPDEYAALVKSGVAP